MRGKKSTAIAEAKSTIIAKPVNAARTRIIRTEAALVISSWSIPQPPQHRINHLTHHRPVDHSKIQRHHRISNPAHAELPRCGLWRDGFVEAAGFLALGNNLCEEIFDLAVVF